MRSIGQILHFLWSTVSFLFKVTCLALLCHESSLAADIRAIDINGLRSAAIVIDGPILDGDAQKFKRVLTSALSGDFTRTGHVMLNSVGGRTAEALDIAAMIRFHYLNTVAPLRHNSGVICPPGITPQDECQCSSACAYIFASGLLRFGNIVAFHQSAMRCIRDGAVSDDCGEHLQEALNDDEAVFLSEGLGLAPEFVAKFRSTPPQELWSLSPAEVERFLGQISPYAEALEGAFCSLERPKEAVDSREFSSRAVMAISGY